MRGSSRNIGQNFALAWPTGGGTHLTLIYFENVKPGYEQERAKRLAEEFLEEQDTPQTMALSLPSERDKERMWSERCIRVINPALIKLRQDLADYFKELGFEMRTLRPLHIDLRGQCEDVLVEEINTREWLL